MRTALLVAAAVAAVTMARWWAVSRWGLIADEAYHLAWARHSAALGFYDQPPLVAWTLAGVSGLAGTSSAALRAPSILGWTAAAALLAPHARTPGLWWTWALGLPPLAWLTALAVPDASLLTLWAAAFAAAIRGGRGWWMAGALGGLASLAKYTGIAVVPLLILGADPAERRTRDPWIGLAIALAALAPNLAWNAAHGWVTLRFQAAEGLWNAHAPGVSGVVWQLLDQVLVVGPVGAVAVAAWGISALRWPRALDRVDRMCLAVCWPLVFGFAVAAIGGPPEAHWPAPAWIGAGLGLARASGRVARVGYLGATLGACATAALAVHVAAPLLHLPADPAVRFAEGAVLADGVARWVVPAATEGPDAQALPILTERYQEAALLAFGAGFVTRTVPGCGRPSQYDLWNAGEPLPERAWFVRPSRSGPPRCVEAVYADVDGPYPIRGFDAAGRAVGAWDLFAVEGRR